MNTLRKNTISLFGDKGREWIETLPITIDKLALHWGLSHIVPVDNMTFHYVAKALTQDHRPVVLKIGCGGKALTEEALALKYFNGQGCIKLIAENDEHHALLLEQAIPGSTLKSLYLKEPDYVMDVFLRTVKKLHSKPLLKENSYRHIRDWLKAIDDLNEDHCPKKLIEKAIELKTRLLSTMTNEVFLHGDLHHDNILKNGDEWLAIDPKGVVGEPEFEIVAFDFMNIQELSNDSDVKAIFEKRVDLLALKAGLNHQRMKDWTFVRLILMTAWLVQDNLDATWAIQLAERI